MREITTEIGITTERGITPEELALLSNLRTIFDNLERIGSSIGPDLREIIGISVRNATESNDPIERIDHLTDAIVRVWREIPRSQRSAVFQGYQEGKKRFGGSYAPKAQVETFCEEVEPQILNLPGTKRYRRE